MKVNYNIIRNNINSENNLFGLQKGQIFQVNVCQRLSGKEAIINIKGQQVKAVFTGNVPNKENAFVKIVNIDNDMLAVEEVNKNITSQTNNLHVTNVLKELGIKPSKEINDVVKMLLDNDVSITKETIKDIKGFLEKGKGEYKDKLDTIKSLIRKGIKITSENLKVVHEALHGEKFNDVLVDLVNNIVPEEIYSLKGIQSKNLSKCLQETLNNIKIMVQSNEDFEKIKSEIKNLLMKLNNGKIYINLKEVLEEASKLNNNDFKQLAYDKILKLINEIDVEDKNMTTIESTDIEAKEGQYDNINENEEHLDIVQNDQLQQALANIDSATKDFVITKVTKEMKLADNKFKELKREIIRNIDTIVYSTKNNKTINQQNTIMTIENTIDTLDRAILKSKVTMFTDMRTERDLLVASSKLTKAKKLLAKGNRSEAIKLLGEVKTSLSKLNWKPSDKKVVHLVVKEGIYNNGRGLENRLMSYFNDIANPLPHHEPSAKNIYEMFRRLGLNYDSEVARSMTSGYEELSKEDIQKNIKATLLELMKNNENSKIDVDNKVMRILDNLTGQQLLSKNEGEQSQQNMYFNIPVNIESKLENLKLFINSKQERGKIDWENSTLYFLIETKKLGETGILLSANKGNISITVKNDSKDVRYQMQPFIDRFKDSLESIGYKVVGCNFAPLKNLEELPEENKVQTEKVKFNFDGKGFDLRI
ncbi:hypothetical protein [Caldisalinibacter kiritimatiensis]|uniref:Flagellar hook-length control protein-like C-terminal domain-containing protein n=1 Tax=Caldisalinibacter kiritimatiensis TaxID=1304284 RepID=R1AW13_9FIRM|nr:hypothetical protein [Caldisalinibacter kiritimatiensis]EOD00832.1 hypothetical protein L21TH_1108 [Caldisalinibacter kiritimatiensis]